MSSVQPNPSVARVLSADVVPKSILKEFRQYEHTTRHSNQLTTTRNYTDRAPYPTYQKWNAPTNHAKQQLDGPVMRVQDGDAKANLVTHLEGGEAVCLWG